jgi:hypothetical protein
MLESFLDFIKTFMTIWLPLPRVSFIDNACQPDSRRLALKYVETPASTDTEEETNI